MRCRGWCGGRTTWYGAPLCVPCAAFGERLNDNGITYWLRK